jgi:hypothetical protein
MLLDAGFLRYKLGTGQAPADASAISAFTDQVAALQATRSTVAWLHDDFDHQAHD